MKKPQLNYPQPTQKIVEEQKPVTQQKNIPSTPEIPLPKVDVKKTTNQLLQSIKPLLEKNININDVNNIRNQLQVTI